MVFLLFFHGLMATLSQFTLLDNPYDPNFQISTSPQLQSLALFFPTHSFAVPSSSLTLNTIYIRTTHKRILPVPTLPLDSKLLHLAVYEVFLFDCALDISSLTCPIVNIDSTIQSKPIFLTLLHLVLHISSLSKSWICCLQNSIPSFFIICTCTLIFVFLQYHPVSLICTPNSLQSPQSSQVNHFQI